MRVKRTGLNTRLANGMYGFMICLLGAASTAGAQDSTAKYTVIAGPDIDVCEGGSVMLNAELGGDATQAVWRGGKGTFDPDRNSLKAEYVPAPEEYGRVLVLTLVGTNPKLNIPPGRDELKIIVNEQPKADAGADQRICAGEPVKLEGKVEKKFKSVEWKSNGTGSFDDAKKATAIYTPSKKDMEGGGLSLEFHVIPNGVCLPVSDAMVVMIEPSLEFDLDPEMSVVKGEPVKLGIKPKETPGKVSWKAVTGTGTFSKPEKAETIYTPSAEDLKKKSVLVEVVAGALTGACQTRKTVTLNFIEKGNQ